MKEALERRHRRGTGRVEPLEARRLLSAYFVSASAGRDGNPGTLAQPFRTIQQAADAAGPGDTVFVRAGTYRETVTPARSGAPGAPLTFQPYNGEQVLIDGADPLTGWAAYQGSVYQAPQPWDLGTGNNQVFVNGQMMTEARWPNTSLDVSHPTLARTTGATIHVVPGPGASTATITDPKLTQPAGYWAGATIHIAPGQGWTAQTGTVTASSPGTLTYSYTSYPPTGHWENPGPYNAYFLTGKFQALDAPGEWYRDSTGKLSLRTPGGENPAADSVEAKHRDFAFNLSGRAYVNVTGFHLFAATITTDAASSHLLLSGLDARYVSHFTLQPVGWQDSTPHSSGIRINGTAITLQDSTIAYSAGDGVFLGGSGNSVRNCLIHDTDYNASDWAPVFVLGPDQTVTGNTAYNSARSGIVFRYSPRVQVLHNVVHDVMLQTSDGGGLYTYGTDGAGSRIAYNFTYAIHAGAFMASGCFLDNICSNYTIDHNVFVDSDFGLKLNPPSRGNRIFNNTIANCRAGLATSGSADMTGTAFTNNVFTKSADFGPGSTQQHNLLQGTDPRFVGGPPHDYRSYQLAPGSPAIDAGSALPPYTNGSAGAAPDVGAFEFGAAPWPTGSSVIPSPAPAPSPPPTPAPSPSPAPTPSPTPAGTPAPAPTPDSTPSPTPAPAPTPSSGPTPSPVPVGAPPPSTAERVRLDRDQLATDLRAYRAAVAAGRAAARTASAAGLARIAADVGRIKADRRNARRDPSALSTLSADNARLAADRLQLHNDAAAARAAPARDKATRLDQIKADKARLHADQIQLRRERQAAPRSTPKPGN